MENKEKMRINTSGEVWKVILSAEEELPRQFKIYCKNTTY